MYVGQSKIAICVAVRETLAIESKGMQDRGVKVVQVDFIDNGLGTSHRFASCNSVFLRRRIAFFNAGSQRLLSSGAPASRRNNVSHSQSLSFWANWRRNQLWRPPKTLDYMGSVDADNVDTAETQSDDNCGYIE